MTSRYYSVKEANAQVGRLSRLFEQLLQLRVQVKVLAARVEGRDEERAGGPADRDSAALAGLLESLHDTAREIVATGCVIKDLESGLVDWPALHRGEDIWLCWRYGEREVAHWHHRDAGYAGRRPVSELHGADQHERR